MMTIGEFERVSGIDRGTIRYYCNEGLLAPERTGEGKSNNRRLYDEDDLKRLQQICIYRKLNRSIAEIKAILNAPDHNPSTALGDAIAQVEREIKHLENVVLMAKVSQVYGVDAFPLGMYADDSIDAAVEELRRNPGFIAAESLSEEEGKKFRARFHRCIMKFASMSDDATYEDIERLVDGYSGIFNRFVPSENPMRLFVFAYGYLGDGLSHAVAERWGGPGTSETIFTSLMLVWAVRAAKAVSPLVDNYYKRLLAGEDCSHEVEELLAWSEEMHRDELTDFNPMRRNTGKEDGDSEWILEGIYEMIGSSVSDEAFLNQLGFSKGEIPTKEAWEAAIKAIEQFKKGTK